MNNLTQYLQSMLPNTDVRELVDIFSVTKKLKRKEKLIEPGQHSSFLAYINSGAFRVYFYNINGDEITTWFSFQNMLVTDLLAYYKNTRAMFFVEAIEDSEIYIVQKSDLEKLYENNTDYREFGRQFAENGMVLLMERMVSIQTKSAEERYLELLEQPRFMEKIPLKYLATYLGITDSSLSRIRRNIS